MTAIKPDLAAAYEQLAPALRRYIARRIGNDGAVDDVLADVFMKALEGLPHYEDRGYPVSAWLYRIARDRTVDYLRRRGRRTVVSLSDDMAVVEEVEDALLDHQEGRAAWALTAGLTAKQRQVLRLRFHQGLSIAEVADLLQTTEGAVKALQARGLAALRRAIGPPAENQPDPSGPADSLPSPPPVLHEAFTAELCQILDGLVALLADHTSRGGVVPDPVAVRVVRLAECTLRSPCRAAGAPAASARGECSDRDS